MKTKLNILVILALVVMMVGVPTAQVRATGTALLEQLPNQATVVQSTVDLCDHAGSSAACLAAENFVVPEGETQTIGEIQLWGTFLDIFNGTVVNPTADSYTVIFYHADTTSGLPGEGFHTETALTPVRVATGVDIILNSQPFPEYKISLTLAEPQTLTAGSYWIEIAEETTQYPIVFAWEMGSADSYGLGQNHWAGLYNPAWQLMPPSSETDPAWDNLALRLIEPAPDSDLDLTFGTDGQVDTGVRNYQSFIFFPTPSVQQSDGRILVGGFNLSGSNPQALLERYTADGVLDVSFDGDGMLFPQVTGSIASVIAGTHIGSQDESLVVGGYQDGSGPAFLFLARYDSTGVPVADFGTAGILTVTLPAGWTGAMPMGSALQSDGKLLITGFTALSGSPNQVGFLMRLDPTDGTLDATFGNGGVVLNIAPGQVTLQSDGKILVSSPTDWSPFTIYRFTTGGAPDTSFDTDGVLEIPASFKCSTLAEGSEGKLYLTAGPYGLNSDSDFFLARLDANGSPDTSFGTQGTGAVFTDFAGGNYDLSCSLLVQADGKVIVGGATIDLEDKGGSALIRYTADGALDESFGSGGKVFTASSITPIIISQLALTPGGKLLATGFTNDIENENSWIALLRYNLGITVQTHTVSGMVFEDSNNNGSQDTGTGPGEMEGGLPDVTVVADTDCDGDFATEVWTQTDIDGTFSLNVPEGGPYCIVPDLDATQVQTTTDYRIDSLSADVTGVLIGVHTLTLQFEPQEFPLAELNQPYNASMTVADGSGVGPYTFTTTRNWVAPGLTLNFNTDTGTLTLSGTPTQLGEFGADYSVTDSRGVKGWPNLGVMVKTQASSFQLTSSVNPAASGTPLTFTFQATGISGDYPPSGYVTFYDSGEVIPGCDSMYVGDTDGTATCSAGALSDGQHVIKADYKNDRYYFDWSSTLNQVVAALALDHFFILPEPSLAGYQMKGLHVDFTGTVNNRFGQVPIPYTCTVNYGDGTVENGDLFSRNGEYIYACYGNEMYTYSSPGTYTITFTINDLNGNKLTDFTIQHTVINDPDPGYITVTPSPAYVNQPVTFTATEDGYMAYYWLVIGQETYFGNTQTATTTFSEAGTYKVYLIAIKYDTATMTTIALADAVEVTVIPPVSADLSITNTDSKDPVKPGTSLTYMLTVKNLGTNTAQTIRLVDTLDRNTTYISISAPKGWVCKYANYAVTCTSASLTSGSSATIKVTVAVNKTAKVGKDLVNNATVSSVTYDPILTNNTVVQKTMVAK